MIPLLYSLHSGNLYGTERMALATIQALRDDFAPIIIAPAGPVHEEAWRLGIPTLTFISPARYFRNLRPYFANHKSVVSIGTRVLHTVTCSALATIYRNRYANIQVVHGGADERLSYGRKRWLAYLNTKQVAVSEYVKERLIANGTESGNISVIENFLPEDRIEKAIQRPPIQTSGLQKVAVISRLDPIKRIDLLLDALELDPSLSSIEFHIYGRGMDEEVLRARALAKHPNVRFLGFRTDVAERLAECDALLHLCPNEPFGLAILEAMASGLPVLVPDQGGAGAIVQDGRNGFRFRADDAWALADKLHYLRQAPVEVMRGVAAEGFRSLRTRFSAECGAEQYRKLIQECLA
jgi:glycosyltransferase involved in cell wall biosynthesis